MTAHVRISLLQRINKAERGLPCIVVQVMLNCLLYIAVGCLTTDNRFRFHPRARFLTRSRSCAKSEMSAGAAGSEPAPSSTQATQMQPLRILATQVTYVLAAGAGTALGNLLNYKGLERVGAGNIHRAHQPILDNAA